MRKQLTVGAITTLSPDLEAAVGIQTACVWGQYMSISIIKYTCNIIINSPLSEVVASSYTGVSYMTYM